MKEEIKIFGMFIFLIMLFLSIISYHRTTESNHISDKKVNDSNTILQIWNVNLTTPIGSRLPSNFTLGFNREYCKKVGCPNNETLNCYRCVI